MTSEMNTGRELANLLAQHQDEFLTAWVKMARQLQDSCDRKLPPKDPKTTSRSLLVSILKALAAGSYPDPENHLSDTALGLRA
jgi:hypothetical protein